MLDSAGQKKLKEVLRQITSLPRGWGTKLRRVLSWSWRATRSMPGSKNGRRLKTG